jgi:threonine synthase
MDIKVKYTQAELTILSTEELDALETELNVIKNDFIETTDFMAMTQVYQIIETLIEEEAEFSTAGAGLSDIEVSLDISREDVISTYSREEAVEIQKTLAERLGTLVTSHAMVALQITLDLIKDIKT